MSDGEDKKQKRISTWHRFMISDVSEMRLLSVDDEKRRKVAEIWARPMVRMPKEGGATYRFINYLTETGLLDDRRDTAGVGWRKFSFVEIVYINTVIALRKFGVKSDTIKQVYDYFSEPYDPDRTGYMGTLWLELLIYINCGGEMELLVHDDGSVVICDPQTMHLFGTNTTSGTLRISLSAMVNEARKTYGMDEVEITSSFGDLPLNNSEVTTVLEMRAMEDADTLTVRRKKNQQTLVQVERTLPRDDDIAKQLASIMDEFGELTVASEGGKVVSLKKSKKTVVKN